MAEAAEPFGTGSDAILQVAAHVAATGADVAAEITQAARLAAQDLVALPPARVRRALEQVLMGPAAGPGLQWLHEAGALAVLLPEVEATVDFSQEAGRRHKDVWEHTKQVVMQAAPRPLVRWAALLHDIGKVPTRALLPDGRVTFHRHAEIGARLFGAIARRLGFARDERQHVAGLILHHLRANAYEPEWTDAAVRRFDHEMGDLLDDLIDLSRADVTSARPGRKQEAARNVEALLQRIESVRALDARVPPLPPGLGDVIMEAFGIPPSRRVGEMRRLCEEAIARGELAERQEPAYYVDYLRRRGITG
ncbi:MAG: HD domain-containing protein [Deltaproteobacteria bacterium]|nr:HD domain-containing protein [Deltaproteobacteria bacterium]